MEAVRTFLSPLASLRLTVALFALCMFLIFAGTLAQVEQGVWQATEQYFRSWVVLIPAQIFLPGSLIHVPDWLVIPFFGGFLLGAALMVNLLAAHLVRFKVSWKRAGILLIHFGIVLMLVSELITALFAEEANMRLDEGSYASHVYDPREVELAVVDPSHPDHDQVVAIPQGLLRDGAVIEHEAMPFIVKVETFYVNSDLVDPRQGLAGTPNPATQGMGQRMIASPKPQVAGTDTDQQINLPSAYITLTRPGQDQPLGTWLVSSYFEDRPQAVPGLDRPWEVSLRFKRTYKPYQIHLIDFSHDKFVGTDTPRNFSSQVRLVDKEYHEDREVLIWMNHPLRYRGETFYQASFLPGDQTSILQVVRNPAWIIPYISCALVTLGMLVHFGAVLTRFTRRTLG